MEKAFLTLEEVKEILGVSERSLYRYIHEGQLRATKIRYWRIDKKDLQRFIDSRANIKKQKKK